MSAWNKNEDHPEGGQVARQGLSPSGGAAGRVPANVGSTISIKGTLSGAEDLSIEGQVEGEISLPQNSVTVGRKGRVKADIRSKSICIEGEVNGNLFGEQEIIIRKSGTVEGNLTAPRVTLENGAKFRGSIDMNPKAPAQASEESRDRGRRQSSIVKPQQLKEPTPA